MNITVITDCINNVYDNSLWFILELPGLENNVREHDVNYLIEFYYE